MSALAGSEFRDDIARILRSKYLNVQTEFRLTATTADILYIDDTNPTFPRQIAIEAKDYASPLTSRDIAEIDNLYRPSLASGEIDFLWIISRHVLSSSPGDTIKRLRNVKYSTIEEFRSSMMNFSGVLQDNILEYEQSPTSANFIQTRIAQSNTTLFEYTLEWLSGPKRGMIVFGGYGLGKTTFSIYLASELSRAYNRGTFKRIPIRITLGRMYTKQDVSSLVCSALSGGEGKASVRDFSFNLFIEANAAGQYLLILDGFDEMKHAMTVEDFVFTFEQMRPLFKENAKVVILGRPDSFISVGEENEVLSSLFENPQTHAKNLDRVEIEYFTDKEILIYLDNFYKSRSELHSPDLKDKFDSLVKRVMHDSDILSRPVQLKMFTEILDTLIGTDIQITRYELYRQFIYKFIIRENRKDARKIANPDGVLAEFDDDRALFMMRMAWWVLAIKKENRFLADEISIGAVPRGIRIRRDNTTSIREAIVGSIIEPMDKSKVIDKKGNRYYFFPHKSYVEFLISQYFSHAKFEREDYALFFECLNPEILAFIGEGPQSGIRKLRNALLFIIHAVDIEIFNVCLLDKEVHDEISSGKSFNTPAQIYIHYLHRSRHAMDASQFALKKLTEARSLEIAITALNCVCIEIMRNPDSYVAAVLLSNIFTLIRPYGLSSLSAGSSYVVYNADNISLYAAVLKSCVTIPDQKNSFSLNLNNLKQLINHAARNSLYVDMTDGIIYQKTARVRISDVTSGMPKDNIEILNEIMRIDGPECRVFSKIHLMGEAEKRFK